MFRFESAHFLLLLIFVPLLWFARIRLSHLTSATLRYSHVTSFFSGLRSPKYPLRYLFALLLLLISLSLLIIGAARPQLVVYDEPVSEMGRDIVLVLDISGSMRAEDFQPNNRLYVAKEVVAEFIKSRTSDRIALVSFAGQSFTQCPLTLDHDMLLSLLESVDFDMVEDGTAIGNALGTALNRLRESKAKSKIIVLLTDGENNAGEIEPLTAAEMAKTMGVKIYCVGVGKKGGAKIPIYDKRWGKRYAVGRDGRPVLTKLDEKTLESIASVSGGKYSRATDAESLKAIYQKISEAEKTELEGRRFSRFNELMRYFVLPGFCILILALILMRTVAIVLP
ncbi:MAG: VWA domain-containing protein [Candidatus Coatesbacteria bacterium]|nr:VWA domain-containing protein [Candidatus Coatesbacteria bacterium]